jgi:hypothetical protein
LNKSAEERLDEERVRFYLAENVLAYVDDEIDNDDLDYYY